MNPMEQALPRSESSILATNKVLKNTYMLLSASLIWTALVAGFAMTTNASPMGGMISSFAALAVLWFVMPKHENKASGIGVVFLFTALLGYGLGPTLSYYAGIQGGEQIITTAFGLTGLIFLSLSGYVLTTKKDFSFITGFLMSGMMIAFFGSLILVGASMFGFHFPMGMLVISGMFALLSSGLILWETSNIIHGGQTNYIAATVTLYVPLYNLFTSLLHILGAFSGGDD